MFNLLIWVTCGVLIIPVVNVEKIKTAKLENIEEREKKCHKDEPITLKWDEVCLARQQGNLGSFSALQNGITVEKDAGVCSTYEASNSLTEPMDIELDSSSDSRDSVNSVNSGMRTAEEIKNDLNWIRWMDYSPYAKDLMKKNKYDSIKQELITVVTYNVLSQILLEKHNHLYKFHDKESLKWETRSSTLVQEFYSFNADILCLQEVDSSLLSSFYDGNLNRMGYQGVYKQRTNDKVDGCAIYFKSDKFNLIQHRTVEFFKKAVHLLDRDNIGIILKLSLKSNPDLEFIVATTHLLYNPNRGDIKLAQTQLMLAEIEKLAYQKRNEEKNQNDYLPIIFTGDMNYSPDNGVYKLVTQSYLEYEGMSRDQLVPTGRGRTLNKTLLSPVLGVTDSCQFASSLLKREGISEPSYSTGALDHYLNLESVYSHIKGNLPEATTNHDKWVTVDYIFYSRLWDDELKMRKDGYLKLVSWLTLPNSKEAELYLRHLPNLGCASDHLPLLATFQLTGKR